ncbi:Translation elongation factor Ts [hydrothermal vent metagenome]|uniref:Translation elongation factor Ts n=1 Tax=hydrothermal vent metagenome TaxID=652676 RepID=A0A3B1AZ68_9ZZZZ
MAITAALVKELRERSGAGMMECKKALVETDGDIEAAIELMRKSGQAKADKKAGRVAAEGLIAIKATDDAKAVAIAEVNCETDFVAKEAAFIEFVDNVAARVLSDKPDSVEALSAMAVTDGDSSIDETRSELINKIGENMSVRRFERIDAVGTVSSYKHGVRIAVVVDIENGDDELGKDIAMHIAASRPSCISEQDVDQALLQKERDIFVAQAAESGKPENIIEKMVEGRIKKYLKEITLMGQPFVKDPDQTVEQLLKSKGATIHRFVRYEVGEGIEKKVENFADEVAAQIGNG